MDFVISILAKVAEYAVAPVVRELSYMVHYKSYVQNLRSKTESLTVTKERLQHALDEALRRGENINADVYDWLSEVENITAEVDHLLRNIEEQANNTRRCSGCSPNLVLRRQLSRKMVKMTRLVVEIQSEGMFDRISSRPNSYVLQMRGYYAFESREPILKGIMSALKDHRVCMIGVHGRGGVGKTVIVKEIARMALEQKLSNNAIMVTVSQSANLERIQEEIADRLGLRFNELSISARAARLRHRLSQETDILIIFDDIWRELDLEMLGVCIWDGHRGCKIMVTSRFKRAVVTMGTEKDFEVGLLPENEAMSLFKKTVGDCPDEDLSKHVVRECEGLPVAIVTMASALRNKRLEIWKDALRQLQRSTIHGSEVLGGSIFASIKMSYDLECDEAKKLLLLCCLHEEDASISMDYLLRYCMGLNLLEECKELEDARARLYTLVHALKSSHLLLDGDSDSEVRMQQTVYDVCKSIALENEQMYGIRNDVELEFFIAHKKHKDSTAVSILYSNICRLVERLDCPQLQLLLLLGNNGSQIPNHVFEKMTELRVLDLSYSCLHPLPSSLCLLQNLVTLCLSNCEIGDVSLFGEFKKLEFLDFSKSNIEELPQEIGQLTSLRWLDLSDCSNLELIEPGVLSELTSLEVLNMERSFTKWEIECVKGERHNASIVELKNLSRLETLHLHIPYPKVIPVDLFSFELQRYKIQIGDIWDWYDNYGISSSKMLKLSKISLTDQYGLERLLKMSEELYLDELQGVNNDICELDREGFPKLKLLEFQNNAEVQYIINSSKETLPCYAFVNLELLLVHKLKNLRSICHGQLTEKSFSNLRKIIVSNCDRLKNLFSFSISKRLLCLKEIEVFECKMIEDIISYDREEDVCEVNDEANDRIELPQLQSLCLGLLPELIQFSSGFGTSFMSPSREELLNADSPIPLFNNKVALPRLQVLILSKINLEKLWAYQIPEISYMQNLKKLTVWGCDKLKYLLSLAVARSLVRLERLEASQCKVLKEVLVMKESVELERMMLLPRLELIILEDLPSLERFCSGSCIECPMLKELKLKNCPKLWTVEKGVEINLKENYSATVRFPCDEKAMVEHLMKQLNCASLLQQTEAHLDMEHGCTSSNTAAPAETRQHQKEP